MVFNITFNNFFSYIVAVRFIGGGNRPEYADKTFVHIFYNVHNLIDINDILHVPFAIDNLSFKQIDWLVFNANFISISAISWREQIWCSINLNTYKIIRNKTYICILNNFFKKNQNCVACVFQTVQRLYVCYSFHYTTKNSSLSHLSI